MSTLLPLVPRPARGEQPTAGKSTRLRAWLPEALAVLVGTGLVSAQGARLGQWIVDDAAITFAYARSVDQGLGPVQQPGAHPVEGYSDPAWLALLVLGRRLGLFDHGSTFGVSDLVWYPKLLGVLSVAGILLAVALTARGLVRRPWLPVLGAATALAINASFVTWAFSGLENPLYGLAVAWLAMTLVRSVAPSGSHPWRLAIGAGLPALLATLTRPDGMVYAAALPLLSLLLLRKNDWVRPVKACALGLAAWGVPYGVFLLWRRQEFGRWLPNTAAAKSQSLPTVHDVHRIGQLVSDAGWAVVLLGALLTGVCLATPGHHRRALTALCVPLLLAAIGFAVLRPDWMPLDRFATPVWVLSAMIGSIALVRVAENTRGRSRVLVALAATGALLATLPAQESAAAAFRRTPTISMCRTAETYGITFNQYADRLHVRTGSVLLPDLGGTLLTSRLTVVDLAGLTSPQIAHYYQVHDWQGLKDHVYATVRPTFIELHPGWRTIASDPRLSRDYLPLYRAGEYVDYVRRSTATDAKSLSAARSWAAHHVPALHAWYLAHPLRSCGSSLPRGRSRL